MKKGIIASINGTNSNVARLITGEIVLGTKDQPMKVGSIVTYTTEKQTQRYAKQADVDAGTVSSLYEADNTTQKLVNIPADQQRDVNRVQGVFADKAKFIELMTQTALLDKEVDLSVNSAAKELAAKFADIV